MNGDDDDNERLPYSYGDFDIDSGDEISFPILTSKVVYNRPSMLLDANYHVLYRYK